MAKNKEKKKFDFGKLFVRIMAVILTILMLLSIAATLIYCLI